MTSAKPQLTPVITSLKLTMDGSEAFLNPTVYREIVGALQYLTFTRPDLTYEVNKVSQFMHQPHLQHWQVLKCILRYVVGTTRFGIRFTPKTNFTLRCFVDVEWGSDPTNRKSTSGFCIYLESNLLTWSSKK